MHIYSAVLKGPLKISGFIDPDDVTQVTVYWGVPDFSSDTVYRLGDVCKPSIDNGYYYQCTTNGRTDLIEPLWNQEETLSGTAVFTAVPWDLWIDSNNNEIIYDSVWSSNPTIDLSNSFFTDYSTSVFLSNIPNDITDFVITNKVTKSNGESLSRSFLYKINQQ